MYQLGRCLQFIGLCLLPAGLVVGLVEQNIRFEINIFVVGGALFLLGKAIQGKRKPS